MFRSQKGLKYSPYLKTFKGFNLELLKVVRLNFDYRINAKKKVNKMELKKVTVKSFKELLKTNCFANAKFKGYQDFYANNIKDVKFDKFGKSEQISIEYKDRYIDILWKNDNYSYPIYFKGLEIYKIENLENAFIILDFCNVTYLKLGKAS